MSSFLSVFDIATNGMLIAVDPHESLPITIYHQEEMSMFMRVNLDQPINELMQQFLTEEIVPAAPVQPVIDVEEYENESVVLVELPGVKKEDISISVENGLLTLKGERKPLLTAEVKRVLHREIEARQFGRTIRMPHAVDITAVSAELENGILKVTLPKSAEVRPRTIEVK